LKSIVFDAGPVISLTTNNLLWLLEELKKKYKGEFYLAEAAKKELIDMPLETKKFKFEALQVLRCINEDILKIIQNSELEEETINLGEIYRKLKMIEQRMATKADLDRALETVAVVSNKDTMRQIKESHEDEKKGRLRKISSVNDI